MRQEALAWGVLVVAAFVLTARAAAAESEGFAEAGLGAAVPLGDQRSDRTFTTSPSLAVRGGLSRQPWAVDASLAFTSLYPGDGLPEHPNSERIRLTAGGRLLQPLGRTVGYLRAAVGIEYLRLHYLTGSDPDGGLDELVITDDGLALDLAAGATTRLGPVHVGAHLGLAVALHGDERRTYLLEPMLTAVVSF